MVLLVFLEKMTFIGRIQHIRLILNYIKIKYYTRKLIYLLSKYLHIYKFFLIYISNFNNNNLDIER